MIARRMGLGQMGGYANQAARMAALDQMSDQQDDLMFPKKRRNIVAGRASRTMPTRLESVVRSGRMASRTMPIRNAATLSAGLTRAGMAGRGIGAIRPGMTYQNRIANSPQIYTDRFGAF